MIPQSWFGFTDAQNFMRIATNLPTGNGPSRSPDAKA